MFKKHWKTAAHILLLALLAVLLFAVCRRSIQAAPAPCAPLTFTGQYSLNGSPWQPLEEGTTLSALDGPLTLQGHFDREIRAGETLNLLLDHQEYRLLVNDQLISASPAWEWQPSVSSCGRVWHSIEMPAVSVQDTVELQLHSHHDFSIPSAYGSLLKSMNIGERSALRDALSVYTLPLWALGILVGILSFSIMGIALAFALAKIGESYRMWSLGLLAFCMGCNICLRLPDATLLLGTTFVTYSALLCSMLMSLELHIFLARALSGQRKKLTCITLGFHCAAVALMALVAFSGRVLLFDLVPLWAIMQLLLCPPLIFCCCRECYAFGRRISPTVPSAALVLLCALVELVGMFFPSFPRGIVIVPVFLVLFFLLLGRSARAIAANHQRAGQAEQLAVDLENSRILMAMNQIRTHFIFNVLNAISGMCKYDPEKADRTVVRFARFLRTNIDIMQSDVPVTFNTALRHVEDYIALEQIRFGDTVHFVTDIEEDFFALPPLVLQPLVENAIKYGLNPKPGGGTITLRTRIEGDDVCVSVHDDGMGFDPSLPVRDGSVGLQNVRFRLKHVMNGSLSIDSAPGKGTTATIRIPLEEATKCM